MSNWYDTLSASYGHRFRTDGEQSAFYAIVSEVTDAKNDEIHKSIIAASLAGARPSGPRAQYGNVDANDVIKWVFMARKRQEARIDSQSDSERFKREWIAKLKAGYSEELMREEAFYIHELNEYEVSVVIAQVLDAVKAELNEGE